MNPFTLMFGKEPLLTIRRDQVISRIFSDFSSPLPSSQTYILVGARGAGKTAFNDGLIFEWLCKIVA